MKGHAKSFFRFQFNGLGDPHAKQVKTYIFMGMVKVKFTLKQVTKAQRGVEV